MLHILLFVQSQLRAIAVSNLANYHNYQIAIGVSCINLGIKKCAASTKDYRLDSWSDHRRSRSHDYEWHRNDHIVLGIRKVKRMLIWQKAVARMIVENIEMRHQPLPTIAEPSVSKRHHLKSNKSEILFLWLGIIVERILVWTLGKISKLVGGWRTS